MYQNSALPRLCPSRRLAVSLSLSLAICAAPLAAQDETDEEESPYRPGLVARYVADDRSASRLDEALAFDWQDAPPDPRLGPGPFSATWSGRLWVQSPGEHRLALYVGGGKVALRLAGRELLAGQSDEPAWIVSESIALEFDRHPLEITFTKTGRKAWLSLFWSGPGFMLEPVPERFLMHDRQQTVPAEFERGRRLATALRCDACHGNDEQRDALAAPALDRLSGNIDSDWIVDWLSQPAGEPSEAIVRRMPHFGLSREEAAHVAAWLVRPTSEETPPQAEPKVAKTDKGTGKGGKEKPSAAEGQRLFLTLGCLACHQKGELGESGLFGGGDLTHIAAKRPPDFFARWLSDPAALNRHHRMPVFELSATERDSLGLFLVNKAEGAVGNALRGVPESEAVGDPAEGERLITRFRCSSCHALPGEAGSPKSVRLARLTAKSDWSRSCAGRSDATLTRPGYRLAESDQAALKTYYAGLGTPQSAAPTPHIRGRDLLVELNCLACHAREGINRGVNSLPARLQDKLAAVVAIHDELGKQVPAMTPPALASVGDKLHDAALAAAILRKDKPHRPYLLVQMPKFKLTDEQLASLTAYFTVTDRIPSRESEAPGREGEAPAEPRAGETPTPQLTAAGPRLVTADGFACTSCHQIGGVLPDKAPLNARGPDLSMLEKRIRREWFNRWCNNPARIVPRMEMPSVQVPVRGVLGDNIHDQLAAVWHILNTPGFQPPEPNPVRVLRLSGVPEKKEQPIVLHDVIKSGDKTYLFPLVIGLPNRHNVLFDLETNRLAAWWLGDTARQRTKGKSWYWEVGGEPVFLTSFAEPELMLVLGEKAYRPLKEGQFTSTLGNLSHNMSGQELMVFRQLSYELPGHDGHERDIWIRDSFFPIRAGEADWNSGFYRVLYVARVPKGGKLRIHLIDSKAARLGIYDPAKRAFLLDGGKIRIQIGEVPGFRWNGDGSFDCDAPPMSNRIENSIILRYSTESIADQYLQEPAELEQVKATTVDIAPGFIGRRLPLPGEIMPTALDWNPDGKLVFTTLKGQLHVVNDLDEDGLGDLLGTYADGLAAPYGVCANKNHIDVLTKTALFRVDLTRRYFGPSDVTLLASGWGVTDDYHDWAVGLVRGDAGEYYIGLPCQQDNRPDAAAKHRGQLLKLVPRDAASDNPRLFDIEVVSSGHRFPMGLARNRDGALFVTDNQGNYNPFNELNHVRPGAHFGFINANEKERGFKPPPLTRPAIDIPHPWTRSVNGICFLETPVGWVKDAQHPPTHAESARTPRGSAPAGAGLTHPTAFGPLEGHLVGCEYDTRQLIRMTLQKVGDTYQGAAYPLSIPPENVENGLLGPIVCAVSPRGELYVGNIRDSGWGAGNNVGDIVQIKIEPEKLPCGIAEVRATKDGFTLDFFRPVDVAKAKDAANYSIASYRRESTPAYGGPNLDRRIENISATEVSPDGKRVTVKLDNLREGFVYEFQLKPLTRGKALFHPAEAHYTLNKVP